jgi:hypothetical protein
MTAVFVCCFLCFRGQDTSCIAFRAQRRDRRYYVRAAELVFLILVLLSLEIYYMHFLLLAS